MNLRQIEDSYLKDKVIVYAVAVDNNGYLPTHNAIFSVSGGGINTDRTKRIFDDPVGLVASQNKETYLLQEYKRDTGETMWDISVPIYVNGRHWGAFRIGFSIEETNKQIAAIRNQVIGGGSTALRSPWAIRFASCSSRFTWKVIRFEIYRISIIMAAIRECRRSCKKN